VRRRCWCRRPWPASELDRLRTGEIDVAVVSVYPHQALDTDQLDLRHLLDDLLTVALPAGHELARRGVVRLAELAEESWVEGFPDSAETLDDACRRAGFRPRIGFAARSWTAKQGFVAAGLGLALVPQLAAGTLRPDIALARLHPHDAQVRRIYAATWRGIATPPAAAAFLGYLKTAAAALQAAQPSGA
jgi:DNA-binding transcriptional LysR family regulator